MVRTIGIMILGLVMALGVAVPAMAAVKIYVNGTQITDTQISQRSKLLQMERRGGGSQAASKELVDEALIMQEAKRLGITVSDAEVDTALVSVARNLKIGSDKLVALLQQNGVSIDTLRDRLRSTLAWQSVTSAAVRPGVQASDLELEQRAEGKLNAANSFDYVLKEIIFIGNAGSRSGQANQYRKNFQGCDTAVQLSTQYTDAAVVDVGRRHATQMPEALAKELAGLNVGGITKPRATATGMSMLAVCSKTAAEDTTFIKRELANEVTGEAMAGAADKYLADLRAKANIVYN